MSAPKGGSSQGGDPAPRMTAYWKQLAGPQRKSVLRDLRQAFDVAVDRMNRLCGCAETAGTFFGVVASPHGDLGLSAVERVLSRRMAEIQPQVALDRIVTTWRMQELSAQTRASVESNSI